jgi:lipopolysaccharide transport system ATP-binding protein
MLHRDMISAVNICKTFRLYNSPSDRLKEIFLGSKHHRDFCALRGISFQIEPGEVLGIIGQNGAGKSTILKILTGVLIPNSGTIHVEGRITGLLELGTGFNSELTGLRNIYLNGILLGMSQGEIQAKLDRITSFSELGDFLGQQLKTYSTGMVMRLAFSIAIHADPQAFVVDEAFSVGDAYFQQKCMKKIREFKERGGMIAFVSHDLNAVKVLCDKAILLDHGLVVDEGTPEKVVKTYNFLLARKGMGEDLRCCGNEARSNGYGSYKVEINSVRMLDEHGSDTEIFTAGAPCTIEIGLKATDAVDGVTVGILMRDRFGQDIFGTNTFTLRIPIELQEGEIIQVKYIMDELNLGCGKYTLTVAAHRDLVHINECYEWVDEIKSFEVVVDPACLFIGIARLKPRVQLERRFADSPIPG